MTVKTQSTAELHDEIEPYEEVAVLQSILADQGQALTYEEAVVLGDELLGFFEALSSDSDEESQFDA